MLHISKNQMNPYIFENMFIYFSFNYMCNNKIYNLKIDGTIFFFLNEKKIYKNTIIIEEHKIVLE